jgi:MSHA biogenesis protein MshG
MNSLAKSGIPILRSVRDLGDSTKSKTMSVALDDMANQLERGRTLSSALNKYNQLVGRLFVSIVHVGENIGKSNDAFFTVLCFT